MERLQATRVGYAAAWLLVVGLVLSGPLTVVAVSQFAPQPVEWQGIEVYARAFHPLQQLTYGFGFLIILGSLGLLVAYHALARPEQRIFTTMALVAGAVFASIISINYMFQLAVLMPNIAAGRLQGMELLAFNNPASMAMALEMLGYGFQGLATWLIVPLFARRGLEGWLRWLGIANMVVSVLGTALQATVGLRGWVGLGAYLLWNVLFLVLCVLYLVHMRRWHRHERAAAAASGGAGGGVVATAA